MIEQERGLFVSEFPTQGSPEVWEFHNKDNPHSGRADGRTHQQILVDLTQRMMGQFGSVEEFAAYSGILQGEFIKAEIEHFRREKWAISGALHWMFDDCWPAVSWSLVDYFLRPKPAYYHAKRACAPVIVSFKQLDKRVELYVTSDERLAGVEGILRVGVFTFETCGFETETVPVKLGPNASRSFWESAPLDQVLRDPARQCLVGLLESGGKIIARNSYFALPFGRMEFPPPKLLVEREQVTQDRHRMVIAANAYARNVAIANLPASARPSDNYFDLLPGERCEVTIDRLTVEEANEVRVHVWGR
jgi:beta-mannosidase